MVLVGEEERNALIEEAILLEEEEGDERDGEEGDGGTKHIARNTLQHLGREEAPHPILEHKLEAG